jgi:Fe-S cluster biogenesis protein NfuA
MSWLSRILGSADAAPQPPSGDPDRVLAVERVLDELRPMLALDGGDFELVSVEDGIVTLRARGACVGCHAQAMTLTQALEVRLRERCPWLTELRPSS